MIAKRICVIFNAEADCRAHEMSEKADIATSRREAMKLGLAGASGGISSMIGLSRAVAQPPPPAFAPPRNPEFPGSPTWQTEMVEFAPNCYAHIRGDGPPSTGAAISNAGFVEGDNGVMVIDTLAGPLGTQAFIDEIRKVTDKPFEKLIYSHHHGDHTNGGNLFGTPGLEVVGTPYCRERLLQMEASVAGGQDDPAYGDISPDHGVG